MLTKKNILYFIQFLIGSLITFIGMYLIIFPDFKTPDFEKAELIAYTKIDYTVLLLYIPTFVFHIISYTLMNACQENGVTKRKKILSILFVILFATFLLTIGCIYLFSKQFPIAFVIYMIFTLLFVGYLIYLTVKTFTPERTQ